MRNTTKRTAYKILYLSWFNDFLTLPRFAEYYGMDEKQALRAINKGRVLHNDRFGNT